MEKVNKFGQRIYSAFDYQGKFTWYSHCFECGQKVIVSNRARYKILCDRCKNEIKKQNTLDQQEDTALKHQVRFQNAISFLETKVRDINTYHNAIEKAKEKILRYGSQDEVIAAIVMLHNGYSVIAQQKIGRYRVDFVLPEDKIIVEIDGRIFHNDKNKERQRDNEISLKMGVEWRIIHIPTDLLEKSPFSLIKAIENADEIYKKAFQ